MGLACTCVPGTQHTGQAVTDSPVESAGRDRKAPGHSVPFCRRPARFTQRLWRGHPVPTLTGGHSSIQQGRGQWAHDHLHPRKGVSADGCRWCLVVVVKAMCVTRDS